MVKETKHSIPLNPQEEDDARGSTGGSGEIEFRYKDILSGPTRDDLLPPHELKRLMAVHKEIHKGHVEKQKLERQQREALKSGAYIAPTAEQVQKGLRNGGGGGGSSSPYKKHPISDKAQFSGIDKQVIGIAALNEAETNDKLKDELENRLENRLQNRAQPKFNPKPSFRG